MSNIQKPKGEFRQYIEIDGRWRHVYIKSTQFQTTIFGEEVKMVEYTLTKTSKTVHLAERSAFHKEKPRTRKNVDGIA